jgi:hypothetical protein
LLTRLDSELGIIAMTPVSLSVYSTFRKRLSYLRGKLHLRHGKAPD